MSYVQQNCNFIVYICIQLGSEDRMPAYATMKLIRENAFSMKTVNFFIRTEHLEKINLPTICGDATFAFNPIFLILKLLSFL